MADRFVDLQGELLAPQIEGRLAGRTLRRRQQCPGLLGDTGRVGAEVDLVDQLPPAARGTAPELRG